MKKISDTNDRNTPPQNSTAIDLEAFAWTYSQKSGELEQDGRKLATGYSGAGQGKNNPEMQNIHNAGPIPQGDWPASRFKNARPLRTQTHP